MRGAGFSPVFTGKKMCANREEEKWGGLARFVDLVTKKQHKK